jgi:predicted molibdopterin-dependent oxidoreductase YjgC
VKTVSPFHTLDTGQPRVRIRFEGAELLLRDGENLAAELLGAGVMPFRHTPVSQAPRNPYCMMGACFDCLVEIDGVTCQACMTDVRDGMEVTRPKTGEVNRD